MKTAIIFILAGAGVLSMAGIALLGLLIWIAKGSPDVNGDPERDGTEPFCDDGH